jgi:hypothetical protein
MPEKTHHEEGGASKIKEARKSIQELIPPGFIEHRRAARKEMLLAMRSLLDAAIERTEKKAAE